MFRILRVLWRRSRRGQSPIQIIKPLHQGGHCCGSRAVLEHEKVILAGIPIPLGLQGLFFARLLGPKTLNPKPWGLGLRVCSWAIGLRVRKVLGFWQLPRFGVPRVQNFHDTAPGCCAVTRCTSDYFWHGQSFKPLLWLSPKTY